VSVLKIGNEFVLVGVTPTQVSLLSELPGLKATFDSERVLERGSFREAISEEVSRMHSPKGATA
jgi:flagellar biogenesis protein FliO